MNCEMGKSIPLYYYGELPPEEEERLEDHLDACSSCRADLERHRALAVALDRREKSPEPALADRCRGDLMAAVRALGEVRPVTAQEAGYLKLPDAPAAGRRTSLWDFFRGSPRTIAAVALLDPPRPAAPAIGERLSALGAAIWNLRQPIGAVALLAIGYFSAQWTAARPRASNETGEPYVARVRSVQPDASGRVRIELDDVRKRVVLGRMDEGRIQQLLLAAARDDSNPGLRVESVEILKDHAASAEVRAALLDAVMHDPNAGVRLKALEGLKTFAADLEVRKMLPQILLKDENPAVRIQAIDMLTSMRDDSMVGVLQNMVGKEDNGYVRWRCEKALKDMNASVGTF
jgi:hypothetical protein